MRKPSDSSINFLNFTTDSSGSFAKSALNTGIFEMSAMTNFEPTGIKVAALSITFLLNEPFLRLPPKPAITIFPSSFINCVF
jgi:hypothetical protein